MTSELVVTPRFDRTQVQDPNIWQRAPTSRDQDAIADAYTIELHPPSQDAPSSSGTHATLKNHQLTSAHPLFNRVPRFRRAEVSYAEVYIEPRSPHTFLIMELEIPDYLSRPNKTWLRIERRVDPDQKISYLRQLRSRTKAADWVQQGSKEQLVAGASLVNRQTFPGPKPSGSEIERVLDVIIDRAGKYGALTTNCRFICSLIQEHFAEQYDAELEIGSFLVWLHSSQQISALKPFLRPARARQNAIDTSVSHGPYIPSPIATQRPSLMEGIAEEFNKLVACTYDLGKQLVAASSPFAEAAVPAITPQQIVSCTHARIFTSLFQPFHPAIHEEESKRYSGCENEKFSRGPLRDAIAWRKSVFTMIDDSVQSRRQEIAHRLDSIAHEVATSIQKLTMQAIAASISETIGGIIRQVYDWITRLKRSPSSCHPVLRSEDSSPLLMLHLNEWFEDGDKLCTRPVRRARLSYATTRDSVGTMASATSIELDRKRLYSQSTDRTSLVSEPVSDPMLSVESGIIVKHNLALEIPSSSPREIGRTLPLPEASNPFLTPRSSMEPLTAPQPAPEIAASVPKPSFTVSIPPPIAQSSSLLPPLPPMSPLISEDNPLVLLSSPPITLSIPASTPEPGGNFLSLPQTSPSPFLSPQSSVTELSHPPSQLGGSSTTALLPSNDPLPTKPSPTKPGAMKRLKSWFQRHNPLRRH